MNRGSVSRRLWIFVRVLLLVYLVLLALIFFSHVVDLIVIAPNHQQLDPQGAERLLIAMDGGNIEVWKAGSSGADSAAPAGFVLRFVGQGDRADRWATSTARHWGHWPVEVWVMNYPGSGGSTGPARLDSLCPAALKTFDALHKVAGSRPIFVEANSLGTAVALALATQRPVAGLVLRDPAPLRQVILQRQGLWNMWLLAGPASTQVPSELDAVVNASYTNAPAVFVLSEKDTSIPPPLQRLVVNAYKGPAREVVVRGAQHSAPLTPEAERELSKNLDWLWQAARR